MNILHDLLILLADIIIGYNIGIMKYKQKIISPISSIIIITIIIILIVLGLFFK
jgi:hypothetical protein